MNGKAGKEAMLRDAASLMRNLVVFNQGLKDLPESRTISIKLKYYDGTPTDYGGWMRVSGFKSSPSPQLLALSTSEPAYFRAAESNAFSKFDFSP